jgi:hypothetical protein
MKIGKLIATSLHSKFTLGALALLVSLGSGCGDLFRKQPDIKIESFIVMPDVVPMPTATQPQVITIKRRVESSTGQYELTWLVAPLDSMLATTGSAGETSSFLPPYENSRSRFLAASNSCSSSACVGTEVVTKCMYRIVSPAAGSDQTLVREISCDDSIPLKFAPGKYRWFAVADNFRGKEITRDVAQSRFEGTITLD